MSPFLFLVLFVPVVVKRVFLLMDCDKFMKHDVVIFFGFLLDGFVQLIVEPR